MNLFNTSRHIRLTLLPVLTTNRQLVVVDIVANSVYFIARMFYVLSTLSPVCTGPKQHRVEFNFVASVYRALEL